MKNLLSPVAHLIISILVLLSSCKKNDEQTRTAELQDYATGQPIQNASVEIGQEDGGNDVVFTDTSGRFTYNWKKHGIGFQFSKEGYWDGLPNSYDQYNTPPAVFYLFKTGVVKVLLRNIDSVQSDDDLVRLILKFPFVPGNPFNDVYLIDSTMDVEHFDSATAYFHTVAGVENDLLIQFDSLMIQQINDSVYIHIGHQDSLFLATDQDTTVVHFTF